MSKILHHRPTTTLGFSARRATALILGIATVCIGLTACDGREIRFPEDAEIVKALRENFANDVESAKAHELVQVLAGKKGRLNYQIRKVIYRQGAFEVRYDVTLRMGQAGEESLLKLYETMIPKDDAAKLTEHTLSAYEEWLEHSLQSNEGLRASLHSLGQCYRTAKAGDSVPLMKGLQALILPARDGWSAEKLQSPQAQLQCLPL